MKSRREASKCREWEKVRRDKLNKCFATLRKLLPSHDPSLTLTKIDVLQKATEYIEELQKKLKDVLTADGVKKTECEEIKALYEHIEKLLLRNEQLSNLLKEAGIRLPSEYGNIKGFRKPTRWRWSNKITSEQAKEFAKEESQKENKNETNKLVKKPKLKDSIKKPAISPAVKRRKLDSKKSSGISRVPIAKKSTVISVQLSNIMPIARQSLPTVSTQSCFIITNNPPIGLPSALNCRTNKAASTVVTNSTSLITPKMASTIKPPTSTVIPKVTATLNSLGPGTLILANGNIVPILSQPTTVLTNPTSLLLKPPSSTTTLIVMPPKNGKEETVATSSSRKATTAAATTGNCSTKVFANIKPKIGITRTTQVNKVPIPALTSRYSDLTLSSAKSDKAVKKLRLEDKLANLKNVVKLNKSKRKVVTATNLNSKRLKPNTDVATQPEESSVKSDSADVSQETSKTNVKIDSVNSENKEVSTSSAISESVDSDSNKRVPLDQATESNKINAASVPAPTESNKNEDEKSESGDQSSVVEISKINSQECSKEVAEETKESKPNVITADVAMKEKLTEVPNSNDSKSLQESNGKDVVADKQPANEEVASINETVDNKLDKNKAAAASDYQVSTNEDKTISKSKELSNTVIKPNPPVLQTDTNAEAPDKNLELGMNLNHSELSNDIFSSLQVPIGGQNPESTSPTAAFLLAFPLVSSLTGVKVTEVIEEENSDSRHGTPTLLQIGTMDTTKTTQSVHSESLTPNLLNLDNFSFFSGKDMCSNFYSSFENCATNNAYPVSSVQVLDSSKNSSCKESVKQSKVVCEPQVQVKPQNVQGKQTTSEPPPNALTTSTAAVVYTTEGQVTAKSNVTQNNYVRQSTSVSYSKLASVSISSSYTPSSHVHYDGRHKNTSTGTTSTCKDVVSYSTPNRKNVEPILSASQYNTSTSTAASVAQCNAFNPFSDFSKPNAVHSYATFSKPYSDPLYTNSTHYNYPHHNDNNFEQGVYYPTKSTSSKASASAYGTVNYSETSYSMDCKTKRESNQRHNPVNYYNQAKTQTKAAHSSKGSKIATNQPKPPINWMTTPDFRPQPTNTEYLVPPFGKDIEYNPNSFYSSNSFASTTHASYFNATSSMYTPEFQNSKTFDSSLPIISTNATQRNEYEENQFSWSPTKLPQFLETPHSFVSSTLPTLVGDLALGTTQQPFGEQKVEQATTRDHIIKAKESSRRSKAHSVTYDNQSNFLSVSQLVESKTDPTSVRANRRNSGNRNVKNASQKASKHSHKPAEPKELVEGTGQGLVMEKGNLLKQNQAPNVNYSMQVVTENSNWMPDCNKTRHGHKNPQSSYSAEALIGHQDQDSSVPKQRYRQQQTNYAMPNKVPIPTFLSDNIVPYFPPVEIPQDNNFMQTNTNYQSSALTHSFSTSVQNNAYPSGTYISTGATITSSYLQSSGLIPEFGTHDYTTPISDNVPQPAVASDKIADGKHCNNRNDVIKQPVNNTNRTEERLIVPQQINTDCSANTTNNFIKKSKHKHSNESNLPGLVDFGFLSMPSTINSPILPDDFHAHSNFLPPPTPSQLYPCKNPLYSKQSSDLNSGPLLSLPPVPVTRTATQHFEGSAAASNAGSSLTSFNLSAIFPEINKGAVPLTGLYSEPSRNKNYNFQRNYLGGSVQVSFSNKSTSSSYVNSVATSYASTN